MESSSNNPAPAARAANDHGRLKVMPSSSKLMFYRTTDGQLCSEVHVTNTTAQQLSILVKVKTNSPKRYLVKPHIDVLGPRETHTISITVNKAFTDEFLSDLQVVSRGGSGAGVAFILQELTVPPVELPELLERVAVAKQVQGGRPVGSVSAVLGEYFKALEARGADAHEPVRNIKLTAVMVEAPIGEEVLRAHGEDAAAHDGGAPSGAGDIVSVASVGDAGARAESVSAAWHDTVLDSGPETTLPLRGGASAAAAVTGAAVTAHRYSPSHGAGGGASSAAQEAELLALRDKFNNVAAEVLALTAEKQGLTHAVIKREREFEDLRQQYATLVQQRDARPLGGDGLRRRGRGSAGVDEDEDDDTTKDHSQVAGFLLWQLILTAVVAFLLGRLTAAAAPGPLLPP